MEHVETGDDVVSWVLAAEDERRQVCPNDRDGEHATLNDPQARPREKVVRQRVPGVAPDDAHHQQTEADQPVELSRCAECTGEEDAYQMQRDGGDEYVRRQ